LRALDKYELSKVADALNEETFQPGEYIIRQNDPGDKFYIVEKVRASCFAVVRCMLRGADQLATYSLRSSAIAG
jgi:CRP-like cAMP-binding protein